MRDVSSFTCDFYIYVNQQYHSKLASKFKENGKGLDGAASLERISCMILQGGTFYNLLP